MYLIGLRKLLATSLSALIPHKKLRHRVRYALHPLNDKRCLNYFLREYVSRELPLVESPALRQDLVGKEIIWQCWLQGLEQAPPLVKFALNSVNQYKQANQEIILITEGNVGEYITFPEHIIRKRAEGKIPPAQYSDLIRIYLLATYGGTWIDATCLLTAPIPQKIMDLDFFLYHSSGEFSYTLIQSCFIRAQANSDLARIWQALMTEYWRREGSLLHYFTMHLLFKALIKGNSQIAERFKEVPYDTDNKMHALFYHVRANGTLNSADIQEAAKLSFIHKLSYKLTIKSSDIISAVPQ